MDEGNANAWLDDKDPLRIAEQIQEREEQGIGHPTAPQDGEILGQDRGREAQKVLTITDAVENLPRGTRTEEAGHQDIGVHHEPVHRVG